MDGQKTSGDWSLNSYNKYRGYIFYSASTHCVYHWSDSSSYPDLCDTYFLPR